MAYNLERLSEDVVTRLSAEPALTLTKLVGDFGVHRQTIEKAFCRATGVPFREYRQKVRLEKARRLLTAEATRTIKEIAYLLRFESTAAFSRFVRTKTGKTPTEIRNGWAQRKNRHNCITFRHFA